MLKLDGVTVHYGTAEAVRDINLNIEKGAVVSVIGANGAGKTTILRAISGLVPLTSVRAQRLHAGNRFLSGTHGGRDRITEALQPRFYVQCRDSFVFNDENL